jgi:hypothetical protein
MDDETVERLVHALEGEQRVIVAGGPETGKSTFSEFAASKLQLQLKAGDDVRAELEQEGVLAKDLWSAASRRVADWVDDPGKWLLEGVVTPRALDHWMTANPDAAIPATVVWFRDPVKQVTDPYHLTMVKGTQTIWSRVAPRLIQRGARIISRDVD